MSVVISPSLFAADMGTLEEELAIVDRCGISVLHVDVMDGHFVPNIAFGPDQVKMLRPYCRAEFDVHMMVEEPDRFIPAFIKAGADSITVHAEACIHLHRTVQLVKSFNKKVGVALNPATPVDMVKSILNLLDRVLVMTVNPGYGGQKTIDEMTDKVRELAALKKTCDDKYRVQVDGGINESNMMSIIHAGAEDIVIGSALFEKGRTEKNIRRYLKMIGGPSHESCQNLR